MFPFSNGAIPCSGSVILPYTEVADAAVSVPHLKTPTLDPEIEMIPDFRPSLQRIRSGSAIGAGAGNHSRHHLMCLF